MSATELLCNNSRITNQEKGRASCD
uniref:Uncharacterized protein n=1 Tax=Arundo donax TaxID=35708 RepID=A0A0A9E3W6_ARUDO